METAVIVMAGLIQTLQLRPEKMAAQLEPGLLATDLADYLVKQGVPFRQAHGLVGQAVQLAEQKKIRLTDLSLADLQNISSQFRGDVESVFEITASLANRSVTGGTAPKALEIQLEEAKKRLNL